MTKEPQLYRYKHRVKATQCYEPHTDFIMITPPCGDQYCITKSDFERDYEPVEPTCKQSLLVDGWKPIEYAPKIDYVPILVHGYNYGKKEEGSHTLVACYHSENATWRPYNGKEISQELQYLTHFMPLPAPPREGK